MSRAGHLKILLVDDDDDLRDAIATGLRLADFDVVEASNGRQALRAVSDGRIGAIVSDIRMPMLDGRQLLQRIKSVDAEMPVILITGHGDIDQAVDAVRNGAYDFLAKPFATERLVDTVGKALDRRRLVIENRLLRAEVDAAVERRQLPLIGTSPAIEALVRAIGQIGTAEIDVLVEGERGSGKTAVAHMLHAAGTERPTSIHIVDCDVLSEQLIDHALFGSTPGRGAATGDGTLMLANVDRLSPATQSRLLHFLQLRDNPEKGKIARGSARKPRIISTSAVSLSGKVQQKEFRSDLYYRLAPVCLDIPPLRARRQDVAALFAMMMRDSANRYQREVPTVSDSIISQLTNHDWPGNLRELQNFSDQVVLNLEKAEANLMTDQDGLAQRVARFEEQAIRIALSEVSGDIRKTCIRLSIPRKTLYDKIGRYGIDLAPFRARPQQRRW